MIFDGFLQWLQTLKNATDGVSLRKMLQPGCFDPELKNAGLVRALLTIQQCRTWIYWNQARREMVPPA